MNCFNPGWRFRRECFCNMAMDPDILFLLFLSRPSSDRSYGRSRVSGCSTQLGEPLPSRHMRLWDFPAWKLSTNYMGRTCFCWAMIAHMMIVLPILLRWIQTWKRQEEGKGASLLEINVHSHLFILRGIQVEHSCYFSSFQAVLLVFLPLNFWFLANNLCFKFVTAVKYVKFEIWWTNQSCSVHVELHPSGHIDSTPQHSLSTYLHQQTNKINFWCEHSFTVTLIILMSIAVIALHSFWGKMEYTVQF